MHRPSTLNFSLEVADANSFGALEAEWNALWARVPRAMHSLRFDWCRTGWQTIGRRRGRELCILAVRDSENLVAVWPLTIAREDGLRVARWLGSETQERRDLLVDPAADLSQLAALLAAALADRGIDRVMAPYVPARSAFVEMFGGQRGFVEHQESDCLLTELNRWPDFVSYWSSFSHRMRARQRNYWRRLERSGRPNLWIPTTHDEIAAALNWTIEHKKKWFAAQKIDDLTLHTPENLDFLERVVQQGQQDGSAVFMALRVDERIVASNCAFVTGDRHDFTLMTYDDEFASISPGRLLTELYVRWCFDHQVATIDWHWRAEHWKSKWANAREPLGVYALDLAEGSRAPATATTVATPAANLRLEIVPEHAIESTADEWDDLYRRVPAASYALRHRWCADGWATVGLPRGRELCILTVRDGARLVAVWPLTIANEEDRLIARWAGAEAQEPRDVLLDPAADRRKIASLFMAALLDRGIDAVMAPFVPLRSAFAALFGEQAGLVTRRRTDAYVTTLADWPDAESYLQSRAASLRSGQRNRWRRLERLGQPNFWVPETVPEAERLFEWLIEQKLAWLARTERSNFSLAFADTREFLRKIVLGGLARRTSSLCALRVDERFVAGKYSFCNATDHFSSQSAYDPALADVSPGRLLTELYVRRCFEEQVRAINWSFGEGHWKSYWADERIPLGVFALVVSRSGWDVLPNEFRPNLGAAFGAGLPTPPCPRPKVSDARAAPAPATVRQPTYDLQIIRDDRGFDSLRTDWNRLWQQSQIPRSFLSFEWCRQGWECVGKVRGRKLSVAVVRDGGETVAIWPLATALEDGCRVARWLGSEGSETRDLLVDPRADLPSLGALLLKELSAAPEIDMVIAPFVREDSHFVRIFAACEGFVERRRLVDLHCPIGDWPDWEHYQTSLSRRMRYEQRRLWRQLGERGGHEFIVAATPAQVEHYYDWMMARKGEWFKAKEIFTLSVMDPEDVEFLRRMSLAALTSNSLYLAALESNGQVLAAFLAFLDRDRRRMRAWLTTYDLAHAELSPSRLLIEETTKWCFAKGYAVLDWGPYLDYKHRWAKQKIPYGVYLLGLSDRGREAVAAIVSS